MEIDDRWQGNLQINVLPEHDRNSGFLVLSLEEREGPASGLTNLEPETSYIHVSFHKFNFVVLKNKWRLMKSICCLSMSGHWPSSSLIFVSRVMRSLGCLWVCFPPNFVRLLMWVPCCLWTPLIFSFSVRSVQYQANIWDHLCILSNFFRFLYDPCLIKGKQEINSSHNFFFVYILFNYTLRILTKERQDH
jgi:hypothetical protein